MTNQRRIKIKSPQELTPEESTKLFNAIMRMAKEPQPTRWESFVDRLRRPKRVLKGTLGWAAFLGLFGVAGGIEQDTLSLGAGIVLLPILGGAMLWAVEEFREDIQ
jgi:hypothetical protein